LELSFFAKGGAGDKAEGQQTDTNMGDHSASRPTGEPSPAIAPKSNHQMPQRCSDDKSAQTHAKNRTHSLGSGNYRGSHHPSSTRGGS
jgi:hypothetical protein